MSQYKIFFKTIVFSVIFLSYSFSCFAQQTKSDFVIGDKIGFQSKILNEKVVIVVIPPFNYKMNPDKKYPVVYVLDAGNNLFATHGIVNYYSVMLRIMPEMIVVGIVNQDREKDYTPTAIKDYPNGGGADKFLNFIDKELTKYIDSAYRVKPFRCIIGHSIGGLLAIHALQTKPDLFNAFIAIDPSLWWDNHLCISKTAEFFKNNKSISKSLFITLSNEKNMGVFQYICELEKNAPESFKWEYIHYKNETHNSLGHKSICAGFEWIFKEWKPEKK